MPIPSLLWASLALAQTADQPWRTIHTEHFRIHYPLVAAPWAEDAASRLEDWHARVMAEVGWTPPKVIDAVVVDPFSDANGLALPWSGAPRTMWFATPPDAASVIGHYRSWGEILLVHEDTHLVHLMRTSRNPWERAASELLGFGPVAAKSPRWVAEGYATVVEGRLSGFGRPNSDNRASLLRRLAQRGELPAYEELDANGRWNGGGYAYLIGSAYLEWLEERAGTGSLRNLWARMSARQIRTFEEAFSGVFGDAPDVLYRRFCAEVTAAALSVEAEEAADARPFQELGWTVGAPDVSPDGTRVAVPRAPRRGVPRIEVWSLEADSKAAADREEAQAEMLDRDPEDVAPVAPPHPPHERVAQRLSEGFAARELHWTADGTALWFSAWTVDAQGRYRPDLYRWTLDGRRTERISQGADLRAPDPGPDGLWAVAVRNDWGQTQIVRLDLGAGAITPITPLSLVQVDAPRVSPDGTRVAWLENRGGGFGAVVLDLESGGRWQTEPGPTGLTLYGLAWSQDGRGLLATAGLDGFVEVHELWRDGGRGRGRLTSTGGGMVASDPVDGERAIFLAMSRNGLDLAEAPLAPRGAPPVGGSAPIRRPELPEAPGMPAAQPIAPEPYGLGPTDVSVIVGTAYGAASEQGQGEFGVRVGDPVGRSELLLLVGLASNRGGAYGGRVEWTYRGLPVRVGIDGFFVGDDAFDLRRAGLAAEGAKGVTGQWWAANARAALVVDRALSRNEPAARQLLYLGMGAGVREASQRWVGASAGLRGTVGRLGGAGYAQAEGSAALRFLRTTPITMSYDLGIASGEGGLDGFVLGGLPSSLSYGPSELWHVGDPAFAAGIVEGSIHDHTELSLDTPIGLYVERHRIGDDLGGHGLSAGGIRTRFDLGAQPFFRVPGLHAEAGVACRFEYPGLGWDPTPCRQVSDYTGWAAVTFGR